MRRIELPEFTETTLASVPLDSEVYDLLTDEGYDLRVLTGVGESKQEVARRRISDSKPLKSWRSWHAREPQLTPDPGGELRIRFALDRDDPTPNRLRIRTPLVNFEQSITLLAVEGEDRKLLVPPTLIFDYTRYMDVRHTEIDIPPTSARVFELHIASPTAEQESQLLQVTRELQSGAEGTRHEQFVIERRPFRIDRIELLQEVEEPHGAEPVLRDYPLRVSTSVQVKERSETETSLKSRREPLSELTVKTTSRNFSRRVRLEVADSNAPQGRRVLTTATLSRIELPGVKSESLSLRFPVQRMREYFLVIENADNAPLELEGVTAQGPAEQVVFLADPSQTYQLAYGQTGLDEPHYDLVALNTGIAAKVPRLQCTLGPANVEAAAKVTTPFSFSRLIENPLVAIPVVVILVGLLGLALYNATGRIDIADSGTPPAQSTP